MKLILLITILFLSCSTIKSFKIPLTDGTYKFTHKFAEHPTMGSIEVIVSIKGNQVKVINNNREGVFKFGVIAEGILMWHSKTQQWFIGQKLSDIDTEEVGGCTDFENVIDFEKRIFWTC